MPLSLEQFAKRLTDSSLISQEDLQAALSAISPPPKNAEQLVRLLVKLKKLTAWQAEQIHLGQGKSLVLGKYVVLDKLGQGGMGIVLKAEHRRMRRTVALKVLSPSISRSKEAIARFHREVQAAARLDHPHIVAAFDADEANGTHFLVMQFVEGTDLAALVRDQGPLTVERALHCVLQTARGLEYAHAHGVVHRDIKPANLLLDSAGSVKILDMGLARLDSAGAAQDQLTGTGQIMGTVDYMAPEQAMDTKTADARADIYSLGVTLWYLLTGRALYNADSVVKKLMAHQNNPVPSLCAACAQASPELEQIFARMVAKTTESRFQTMTDVIAALERCLPGGGSAPSINTGSQESSRRSESMRTVNEDEGRAAQAVASVKSRPAVDREAATMSALSAMTDTDPETQQSLIRLPPQTGTFHGIRRTAQNVPGLPPTNWLIAAAAAALVLLAAVVFFVQTDDGTIRVEINDPSIEVSIKGTEIVFQQADNGHAVTVSPGQKTLVIRRGGFAFETDKLVLKDDETVTLSVELLNGAIAVRQGTDVLGKRPLPTADIAGSGGASHQFALDFNVLLNDGTARVHLPSVLDASQPCTIEMYVTPRSTAAAGQNRMLFGASNQLLWKQYVDDWQFHTWPVTDSVVARDAVVPLQRTHLAAVFTGSELRLFVNGRLQQKAPATQTIPSGQQVCVLGGSQSKSQKWEPFDGLIDQFRLSATVRYDQNFAAPDRMASDSDTLILYNFDEAAGDVLTDSSGHNHHGKIIGAKWVRIDGPAGGAPAGSPPPATDSFTLQFDGVDDYVDTPSLTYDGGPLTVEVRASAADMDLDTGCVLVSFTGPAASTYLWLNTSHDVYGFGRRTAVESLNSIARLDSRPTGMHHWCGVFDGTQVRFFLDGKQVGQQVQEIKGKSTKFLLRLGASLYLDTFFRGDMEELRISRTARYTQDFPAPREFTSDADALVLYHFDEGQGETLIDSSGNNHHGKIVGAKWVRTDEPAAATPGPTAAESPFALEFDGVDDYVDIHSDWVFDGTELTLDAWVIAEPGEKQSYLLAVEHGQGQGDQRRAAHVLRNPWQQSPGTIIPFVHVDAPPSSDVAKFRGDLPTGRLIHVAVVWTPDERQLYIDGRKQRASRFIYDFKDRESAPFTLLGAIAVNSQARGVQSTWTGQMHQVRLSSSALYAADFAPAADLTSDEHTIALYKFDEGQGDVLHDSSGHNRHGKIVGATWTAKISRETGTSTGADGTGR